MYKKGYYLLYVCSWLFFTACNKGVELPDMRETFLHTDDRPNGSSYAYKMTEAAYSDYEIIEKKTGFEEEIYETVDSNAVYISIAKNFLVTNEEFIGLRSFAGRGNTVFISANRFSDTLLKHYGLHSFTDPFPLNQAFLKDTKVSLIKGISSNGSSAFSYFYMPLSNYFIRNKNASYRVLGYNENGEPNFICIIEGWGRIYLHCQPRTMSNYFLTQNVNEGYWRQILQILPATPGDVFYDDFYNHRNKLEDESGQSLLGYLLSLPAIAWAMGLLMLCFLLYVVLNGKSRQRKIPVISQNKNASVAYVEAVSGLYYAQHNNKDLAEKMIAYFFEDMRTKYFIAAGSSQDEWMNLLGRKAGIQQEHINKLIGLINQINAANIVTDEEIKNLHQQLEAFKNKK